MKRIAIIILLFLYVLPAVPQPKTRGKVKRKYRQVEKVGENLPPVVFRGMVRDINKLPVPGACIEIEGLRRLVHSNESGQFMITDLPTGRLRLKISSLGYRTKTIDYALKAGFNDHYVALDRDKVHLENFISSAQKREQQVTDVPADISVLSHSEIRQISKMPFNTDYQIPGLHVEELAAGKYTMSMSGHKSSAPFIHPASVAVFVDDSPSGNRGEGFPLLYDMERIEILEGPQNVLFGRNAVGGAVHFVGKKPDNTTGGYISASGGNFNSKEAQAAANISLVKDMLFIRAAGIYSSSGGNMSNGSEGSLNGGDLLGGKFSLHFIPAFNHKIDLSLNYNKKDFQGIGYRNLWYPGNNQEKSNDFYSVSLNRGSQLGSDHELLGAGLSYRYFLNEHDYWTFTSSYRKSSSGDKWDADGTELPALEMDDKLDGDFLFNEIRYNFSRKSQSNGSAGISYSREKTKGWQGVLSNDQLMFEILDAPGNFLLPGQNRFPVMPQPLNPEPMSGFNFSGDHREEILNEERVSSLQAYFHFTYRLRQKLFFTGGIRAFYDRMELKQESVFTGGAESSLGQLNGTSPNLIYLPAGWQQLTKNSLAVTGQVGLTYRRSETFSFFLNATRGRKPQVLQFTWGSNPQVISPNSVYNADAGWKTIIKNRIYWDVTGFYRQHRNVHSVLWNGTRDDGVMIGNGIATSFGAATQLKAAITEGLSITGDYAWMESAFDSTGVDGSAYIYVGNRFAHAPKHSFSVEAAAKVKLLPGVLLFVTPWYTWQSHVWLTDANTPGLEQPAFGLLNIRTGIELQNPSVVISIHGHNLMEEKYIAGAGHWGGLFGIPTIVLGAPGMVGAKVTWSF